MIRLPLHEEAIALPEMSPARFVQRITVGIHAHISTRETAMSDFEGREREPGTDEESNRPDERNAPPRTESEESKESRPTRENPDEDASRSGQSERKPTGEDVDSGNE